MKNHYKFIIILIVLIGFIICICSICAVISYKSSPYSKGVKEDQVLNPDIERSIQKYFKERCTTETSSIEIQDPITRSKFNYSFNRPAYYNGSVELIINEKVQTGIITIESSNLETAQPTFQAYSYIPDDKNNVPLKDQYGNFSHYCP